MHVFVRPTLFSFSFGGEKLRMWKDHNIHCLKKLEYEREKTKSRKKYIFRKGEGWGEWNERRDTMKREETRNAGAVINLTCLCPIRQANFWKKKEKAVWWCTETNRTFFGVFVSSKNTVYFAPWTGLTGIIKHHCQSAMDTVLSKIF